MQYGRPPRPVERIASHQTQKQRLGRHPARQTPDTRDVPQSLYTLLHLKVAQIFLNDVGHRHAQRSGKILSGHQLLLFRILQQPV